MKVIFLFLFAVNFFGANANVLLPSVIGSNMVLQQQSPVKLWGWASPGEKVYITPSWNNKTDSVITTRDAKWQLQLQTPAAGGPYTVTIKGRNTIVLTNVLIGEVWICSGQSNMEWNYYAGVDGMKDELGGAANPNIRFFHIPKTTSAFPQEDCKAQWAVCDSNTVKTFSAVGYFFGKKLNSDMNVPIGLINASWGGTAAEVWMPAEIIFTNENLKADVAKQKDFPGWTKTPGFAYNGMIAPITAYAVAGVIWYQGEGNTAIPYSYKTIFTAMITAWRKAWMKEIPFHYVQIAPFKYGAAYAGALVQEQQTKSLSLPNTAMIVISDLVPDTTNIHPTNKRDVGVRLANLALAKTYGRNDAAHQYPMYKQMTIEKDKIIVMFDAADAGLMVKGKTVTPLFIAGEDGVFYPAEGKIKNGQLIVQSKAVKKPVAVRYAFSNTAIGNLFSKEGLPVVPFRTDDWKLD